MFLTVLSIIGSILVFVVCLSLLVLIHEFGHFIVAKRNGVRVDEFSIGFPPRIWKIKRGETQYSVGAILLGGYVKMKGEDSAEKGKDSFSEKSIYIRTKIILAGVFLNLVFGILLLAFAFMTTGLPWAKDAKTLPGVEIKSKGYVFVEKVADDFPAKKAGIQENDIIISVNNEEVSTGNELIKTINGKPEQEVTLKIKRDNEEKTIVLTTIKNKEGLGQIGVNPWERPSIIKYSFVDSFKAAFQTTYMLVSGTLLFLWSLISGGVSVSDAKESVTGPIGIFKVVEMAISLGMPYLLQIVAFLSISLAIINVLPFPALDGSRIFFLIFEKLRGRAMASSIEGVIHTVGFAILIILIAIISYNDIKRWFF